MSKQKNLNLISWKCVVCEAEFDQTGFVKHAKDVHGIEPKTPGTRQMTMHADGREFYSTTYRWEINGLVFIQKVQNERAKDDMMRFA